MAASLHSEAWNAQFGVEKTRQERYKVCDDRKDPSEPARVLSELRAHGSGPADRGDILKKHHPGSDDHPTRFQGCHSQGGLCRRCLACSFCHMGPRPKRKSKHHQLAVERRCQERPEGLDELTEMDAERRHILEEYGKHFKEAYERYEPTEVKAAQRQIRQEHQMRMMELQMRVEEAYERLHKKLAASPAAAAGQRPWRLRQEHRGGSEADIDETD